jgi:peptide deformylase
MQDGRPEDADLTKTDPFIFYPDPRLNEVASPRSVDADLLDIGRRLLAAAEDARAYGLAAVHIGVVAPVVVVSLGDLATRDYRVLYNPRVLSTEGPQEAGPEGSVSMPGIEVDVLRAHAAVIAFEDAAGQGQELALSGFPARVAKHEIDQVNGVFFLTKISRLKREAAIRRFAKLGRR